MQNPMFEVVQKNTALREQLMRDARQARSEAMHQYLATLFKALFGKRRRAPVHVLVAGRPEAGRTEHRPIALAA